MTQKENSLGENSVINSKQISKAVKAIYQYVEKTGEEKKQLTEDGQNILIQVCLQKVPPGLKGTTIKIPLPHPLVDETSEICLFVKDLDKKKKDSEATKLHYQELLSSKKIKQDIEVIPLKALKLEYRPYEAKRNLSNRYDMFLADEGIVRLLPSYLGKFFYGRKKFPVPVNLRVNSLAKEIDRALSYAVCAVGGAGSSFAVTVSKTSLTEDESAENITTSLEKICERVPGGQANIKVVYLKSALSPALPVFISEESPNKVILPKLKSKVEEEEFEDVTTVMNAKVRVLPSGVLQMKYDNPEAKRQHEEENKILSKREKRKLNPSQSKVENNTGDSTEKKMKLDHEEPSVVDSVCVDSDAGEKPSLKENTKNKAKLTAKKEKSKQKNKQSVIEKPADEKVRAKIPRKAKNISVDTPVDATKIKVKKEEQVKMSAKKTAKKSPKLEGKGKRQSVKTPKSKKMSK